MSKVTTRPDSAATTPPPAPAFEAERLAAAISDSLNELEACITKIRAASFFLMNYQDDEDAAGLGYIIRDLACESVGRLNLLRLAHVHHTAGG